MHGEPLAPRGRISGKVRGYRIVPGLGTPIGEGMLPGRWHPCSEYSPNDVLYDWATIVGELLRGAPDGKPYKIGGMYFEYENNSGAPVSPPTFDRSGNKTYFDNLSLSSTRDYLRLPLAATSMDSTDEDLFPRGNRLTFYAMSSGMVGVHGKPFSAATSSRVYGGALVAFPSFADATQDLILSRFYFDDEDKQLIKLTGSEVGLSWPITLE